MEGVASWKPFMVEQPEEIFDLVGALENPDPLKVFGLPYIMTLAGINNLYIE